MELNNIYIILNEEHICSLEQYTYNIACHVERV